MIVARCDTPYRGFLMKLTGKLVALAFCGLMTFGLAAQANAADYEVEGGHSTAHFTLTHLNVSEFQGRFNDVGGSYSFDASNPSAAKFNVVIKTKSVDTNDAKRDKHLKGPDFFNAGQFPKMTFVSKKVTGSAKNMKITGDLTIKGITKSVTVDAKFIGEGKDPWGNYRSGLSTTFTINRNDFGINYMPGGLGDDVTVRIALEGIKKK